MNKLVLEKGVQIDLKIQKIKTASKDFVIGELIQYLLTKNEKFDLIEHLDEIYKNVQRGECLPYQHEFEVEDVLYLECKNCGVHKSYE